MLDILKYFGIGMLACFGFGAVKGYVDRRSSEQVMVSMISKHLDVKRVASDTRLEYVCKASPIYAFSLREGVPLPLSMAARVRRTGETQEGASQNS